jgi:hypothetical protein
LFSYKDNITDTGYKIHPGKTFIYDDIKVNQEHGSVFCAICFVSYRYPHLTNAQDVYVNVNIDKTIAFVKNNKTMKNKRNKKHRKK